MRIIVACFVTLFMLSQPVLAEDIKVEELVKSTRSWNGVSLPDCTEREREVTILKITIAAKAKVPMHIHPVINAGYMLSGELTIITQNGEENVIKAGDALVEVVNQAHYGVNKGEVPVEIIVVYFGEEGQPLSITL